MTYMHLFMNSSLEKNVIPLENSILIEGILRIKYLLNIPILISKITGNLVTLCHYVVIF